MASETPDSTGRSPVTDLGLEEIDWMTVEDTYENRSVLRDGKLQWRQVTDEDGSPTGLIRASTPAELTAYRDSTWEKRKPIMQDPANIWSEYVTATEYPADYDAPYWVKRLIHSWIVDEREGKPIEKRRALPVRCETIRHDGTRCWNWVARADGVRRCKPHLGWQSSIDLQRVQAARIMIMQAAPAMAAGLEEMATKAVSEPVRLKAMTEILDRAGVRGGTEVEHKGEVHVVDATAEVKDRLGRLARRMLEEEKRLEAEDAAVIEGEVVEDERGTQDVVPPPRGTEAGGRKTTAIAPPTKRPPAAGVA